MATTDLDLAGQRAVAAVNQRIGVNRTRKPLTPEQIESYRPKAAVASTVPAFPNKMELSKLLGEGSGLPVAAAQRLALYITLLEKRIAALEAR